MLKNDLFKLMNDAVFGKFEKTQRDKTYQNRKKKKLFTVRTKLSYYKVFHRKCIMNSNEENSDINKYMCLLRFINIRSK